MKAGALRDWLGRFEAALADAARADWGALFAAECYWRDLVAFTWDIATLEGADAIAAMARAQAGPIDARDFTPDDPALAMTDDHKGWFRFETATARCRGHVQLDGDGRAKVLLTAIVELIDHEEIGGLRRPQGCGASGGEGPADMEGRTRRSGAGAGSRHAALCADRRRGA